MFPIRDRRGRTISFGGRILGDGQPKYVNGPETALFSKRRTLYAFDLARPAVRAGAAVIAVEGYMDVIALHQGGFVGAVAPLGTALTEEQLKDMWRLSATPVLCFDGDAAGARAAARAAELVLPMLSPEHTLRLATLPAGEDPDTLLRNRGPSAFQAVLDAARPLSDVLYGLIRESVGVATPEQRATLRTRLDEAAARIPDRALAGEYRRVLLDRFFADRPARKGGPPAPRRPIMVRMAPDAAGATRERTRCLAAIALNHPALLADLQEAWVSLDLAEEDAALRDAILLWFDHAQALESAALIDHLKSNGFAASVAQVLSSAPVPVPECASPDAMPAEAEAGWWHFFGLMNPLRLEHEIAAATLMFANQPDQAAERRLVALCTARDAVRRGDFETNAAP